MGSLTELKEGQQNSPREGEQSEKSRLPTAVS